MYYAYFIPIRRYSTCTCKCRHCNFNFIGSRDTIQGKWVPFYFVTKMLVDIIWPSHRKHNEWIFNHFVKFVRIYHPLSLKNRVMAMYLIFHHPHPVPCIIYSDIYSRVRSVSTWENLRADNFALLCCLSPAEPLRNLDTLGMLCSENKLHKRLRESRAERVILTEYLGFKAVTRLAGLLLGYPELVVNTAPHSFPFLTDWYIKTQKHRTKDSVSTSRIRVLPIRWQVTPFPCVTEVCSAPSPIFLVVYAPLQCLFCET